MCRRHHGTISTSLAIRPSTFSHTIAEADLDPLRIDIHNRMMATLFAVGVTRPFWRSSSAPRKAGDWVGFNWHLFCLQWTLDLTEKPLRIEFDSGFLNEMGKIIQSSIDRFICTLLRRKYATTVFHHSSKHLRNRQWNAYTWPLILNLSHRSSIFHSEKPLLHVWCTTMIFLGIQFCLLQASKIVPWPLVSAPEN